MMIPIFPWVDALYEETKFFVLILSPCLVLATLIGLSLSLFNLNSFNDVNIQQIAASQNDQ